MIILLYSSPSFYTFFPPDFAFPAWRGLHFFTLNFLPLPSCVVYPSLQIFDHQLNLFGMCKIPKPETEPKAEIVSILHSHFSHNSRTVMENVNKCTVSEKYWVQCSKNINAHRVTCIFLKMIIYQIQSVTLKSTLAPRCLNAVHSNVWNNFSS